MCLYVVYVNFRFQLYTGGDEPTCFCHGAVTLFPLLNQYFDWRNGGVQSILAEVKNTPMNQLKHWKNVLRLNVTTAIKGVKC